MIKKKVVLRTKLNPKLVPEGLLGSTSLNHRKLVMASTGEVWLAGWRPPGEKGAAPLGHGLHLESRVHTQPNSPETHQQIPMENGKLRPRTKGGKGTAGGVGIPGLESPSASHRLGAKWPPFTEPQFPHLLKWGHKFSLTCAQILCGCSVVCNTRWPAPWGSCKD